MSTRSSIVLAAVLHLLKPLVRLMLRHGVAYPSFAVALKQVFLEAAQEDLHQQGRSQTDSAVSLLSGVHRRDVRMLSRPNNAPRLAANAPMNMATQVVARWLTHDNYLYAQGNPRPLQRTEPHGGFDGLVASISSDIRPRAVMDELISLGIAQDTPEGLQLLEPGLVPRQGFEAMATLLGDNVRDHIAAASSNIDGSNFLEQAIFVDQITEASAQHLHAVSAKAWRVAFKTVMQAASQRYDQDQAQAQPEQRTHRMRFGSYFYASPVADEAADKAANEVPAAKAARPKKNPIKSIKSPASSDDKAPAP
jgi:Family of unknown function (DUF6502)